MAYLTQMFTVWCSTVWCSTVWPFVWIAVWCSMAWRFVWIVTQFPTSFLGGEGGGTAVYGVPCAYMCTLVCVCVLALVCVCVCVCAGGIYVCAYAVLCACYTYIHTTTKSYTDTGVYLGQGSRSLASSCSALQ